VPNLWIGHVIIRDGIPVIGNRLSCCSPASGFIQMPVGSQVFDIIQVVQYIPLDVPAVACHSGYFPVAASVIPIILSFAVSPFEKRSGVMR